MGRYNAEHQKKLWGTAACALGLLVYWVLFFGSAVEHRRGLLYLLIPDEALLLWTGGDIRHFAVADRLPVLIGVSGVLGLAFVFGRLSLGLAHSDRNLSRLEIVVFSVGVGLNELSLLTLAIGLAGGLQHRWVFAVPVVLVCSLAAWLWKRGMFQRDGAGREPDDRASIITLRNASSSRSRQASGRSGQNRSLATPATKPDVTALRKVAIEPDERTQTAGDTWLTRWGLWMGLPFLVLILLGGMLPPWDFDVREYHLQVPKEWYQQGRISFLPHNVYGNMSLGAEMHALLGMVFWPGQQAWWWGALVGKTVIACFAPLTALALLAAGQRFASRTAGVVAALAFLSIPWVVHVSISGLIEGALAFYAFSTLYAMLLWSTDRGLAHDGDLKQARRGRLLLAGFLAGSAVACKYPALLFVLVPAVVWCALGVRPVPNPQRRTESDPTFWFRLERTRWRALITLLLAATCGCGLWLGKNWVLAGNPVYPLYFGGQTRTVERMEQWNHAHRVPPDDRGRRYTTAQAIDAIAHVLWRSPWQSAILIPLSLTALLLLTKRWRDGVEPAVRWWLPQDSQQQLVVACAAFTLFFLLAWWLVTHRLDRFWVPVLPALAILAGVGATWSAAGAWRHFLTGVLVCGLTANFLLVLGSHPHRYLVALDVLRMDRPDEPSGPSRLHPAHRYLNTHVSPDGCVLLVGDAQPFDLEVPALYNTCFDESTFERLLKDRTRQQRLAALGERGISYILFDWSEIDRYRSPGNYGFTDYVTRSLVRDELVQEQGLLRKLDLGVDPDWWELYEVVSSPNHQGSGEK